MHCPKCHMANRDNASFCSGCGAPLRPNCPRCGSEQAADALFCDVCGARLPTPRPAAPEAVAERLQRLVPREYAQRLLATRGQLERERRVVTILFSDVKGSTSMAEKVDPEDWAEVMDGVFDILVGCVYRHEGTLVQMMGDAILAFFGAPIAHEDDPERACRAALEITSKVGSYAKELERKRGISGFAVRAGLNTGLVAVGEIGADLRVAYTAVGDAINLATRMEQAAEPGTVLITQTTNKLIAPLFESQALGPLQVKGKGEPVETYRVLAAKPVPGKVRGIAGLESPPVGRKAEVAALQEVPQRLRAGLGSIVTIAGQAGLGKSRLLAEMRGDVAVQRLYNWVEGRCLAYGSSMAYVFWLDTLRALLEVKADATPQQVRDRLRQWMEEVCGEPAADLHPYLGRLLSLPLAAEDEASLRDLGGEKLKINTFRAVEGLIEGTAKRHAAWVQHAPHCTHIGSTCGEQTGGMPDVY